ncbi:hypothetical protein LC76P1_00056 [Lysinibacillus phage LC76P1]|nr:hypothetical protein LC76P1_00056 [Lysinibacillus phage LC76P1]
MTARNNKYNAKKIYVDDIKFDSKAESDYYIYLKYQKKIGNVVDFELQPVFILQEGFTKHGKKHLPIKYVADFKVIYPDGTVKIVDIKGMVTADFKLKYKMFCNKFDEELLLLRHVAKYGGWIELDAHEKIKRANKKAANKAKTKE